MEAGADLLVVEVAFLLVVAGDLGADPVDEHARDLDVELVVLDQLDQEVEGRLEVEQLAEHVFALGETQTVPLRRS